MMIGMSKDIGVYSNSIEFQTEVYQGVYWVPLNTLGKTRYTNDEIYEISKLPIGTKKEQISTLYEAVQLFQISNFQGIMDNSNYWISDKTLWQIHKSQDQAVLSNEGCCATDTNWLSYFIKDKYDFIGSFCYANTDGNGHITTYIKQCDYYYFLDMMMCRADSQKHLCNENGVLSDLSASEWAGFLYKTKDPINFCKFNISRFKAKNRDIPFCFYIRETDCVRATGVELDNKASTFLVPENEKPIIIYCDEDRKNNIKIVELPTQLKMK